MFSLVICKAVYKILSKFGRGSNLPGELFLRMNNKPFKHFKLPNLVIGVTGSAGKGSTSKAIADILTYDDRKVIHNKFGSNMTPGILSLLIANSNNKGEVDGDVLVLEVDERYAKIIFDNVKPNYIVVTNITRDQPPRHGNPDMVLEKIKEALPLDLRYETKLVINADDPYLRKLDLDNKLDTIYYGINIGKYEYLENKFNNINISYCPKCHSKLKYNSYYFESLGDYYCDNCDFKRPNAKYIGNVDLKEYKMIVGVKKIDLPFTSLYSAYNNLAAYSVCKSLGIRQVIIFNALNKIESNSKLSNYYVYNNKRVYLMSNKCENSTTFNQSVMFALNLGYKSNNKKRNIIIGWKEISRRYNMNDLSWLYDINFELLNDGNTNKIICIGRDKYSIKTRFKYANFKEEDIFTFDSVSSIKDVINDLDGDIYAIVNFDLVDSLKDLFKGDL